MTSMLQMCGFEEEAEEVYPLVTWKRALESGAILEGPDGT
jgi:hypothetical protein